MKYLLFSIMILLISFNSILAQDSDIIANYKKNCLRLLAEESKLPVPGKRSHTMDEVMQMINDRYTLAKKIESAYENDEISKFQYEMLKRRNQVHSLGKKCKEDYNCEVSASSTPAKVTKIDPSIIKLLDDEDYTKVIKKLKEITQREPKNAEALFLLAEARTKSFLEIKKSDHRAVVKGFPEVICEPLRENLYLDPNGKNSKIARSLYDIIGCEHDYIWHLAPEDPMEHSRKLSYEGSVANELKNFNWGEYTFAFDQEVYDAQVILKEIGYNVGSIDGICGSKTQSAVQAFQKDKGLPLTREIDEKTKETLLLEQEKFQHKICLSAIWVKTEDVALEVLSSLRSGVEFIELVRKYSIGPAKDKDGYLGCVSDLGLKEEFMNAVADLEIGEFSEVVKTESYYVILMKNYEK